MIFFADTDQDAMNPEGAPELPDMGLFMFQDSLIVPVFGFYPDDNAQMH